MLRLEKLTVRYGDFTAVDGLDLDIAAGEVFGLLGPNGAGKSTTLATLIGRRKPTSGRALLAGLDIAREWQRVKPLFGYVPDRENLFEEMTGRVNLELFADLYSAPRSRVAECLGLVELSEAADVRAGAYSLGMRRKLLLARAILHKPKVLYLDEPTANLDIHSIEIVHRILRGLAAEGTTVVLTTHNMKEVEEVCGRVAILCRGKRVALDSPWALRAAHAERKADVALADGRTLVFDLAAESERAEMGALVASGAATSVKTREFDFRETFLKLTGQVYG